MGSEQGMAEMQSAAEIQAAMSDPAVIGRDRVVEQILSAHGDAACRSWASASIVYRDFRGEIVKYVRIDRH